MSEEKEEGANLLSLLGRITLFDLVSLDIRVTRSNCSFEGQKYCMCGTSGEIQII